mmetsp:Transcript_65267/g.160721  ORF Transcript_65267/g.160721 Transcript_65267/m.160721 type:complete len:216 (+) Transcript_65267:123-770(+)
MLKAQSLKAQRDHPANRAANEEHCSRALLARSACFVVAPQWRRAECGALLPIQALLSLSRLKVCACVCDCVRSLRKKKNLKPRNSSSVDLPPGAPLDEAVGLSGLVHVLRDVSDVRRSKALVAPHRIHAVGWHAVLLVLGRHAVRHELLNSLNLEPIVLDKVLLAQGLGGIRPVPPIDVTLCAALEEELLPSLALVHALRSGRVDGPADEEEREP